MQRDLAGDAAYPQGEAHQAGYQELRSLRLRRQQISSRLSKDDKTLFPFNKAKIHCILPYGQARTTRPPRIHNFMIRSGTSFQENQEIDDKGIGRFQRNLLEW
ncbi:hypothetical protein [Rhizobium tropici]|uniref:hypothetical protein n=1 Tax=Rhizobium tropici TaxID=398 RepID=UPI00165F315A|nr:hypothetical protein [Rhizobium tropici]